MSLSCTISEPDDADDAELMVQLVNQAVEILPQWEFGARQPIKLAAVPHSYGGELPNQVRTLDPTNTGMFTVASFELVKRK